MEEFENLKLEQARIRAKILELEKFMLDYAVKFERADELIERAESLDRDHSLGDVTTYCFVFGLFCFFGFIYFSGWYGRV